MATVLREEKKALCGCSETESCVEHQGDGKELATANLPSDAATGKLLACPSCSQEMYSPDDSLPLHMHDDALCIGSATKGAPSKFGQQITAPLTFEQLGQFSVSEILEASLCWSCGENKRPGQPICLGCRGVLPLIHQKVLPEFVRGFLFASPRAGAAGLTKKEFTEALQSALKCLAEMRAAGRQVAAETGECTK